MLLLSCGHGYCFFCPDTSSCKDDASYRELQMRLNEQKKATTQATRWQLRRRAGSCPRLRCSKWREPKRREGSWSQAVDLYKQSLAIEDRADARSELASQQREILIARPSTTSSQLKSLKARESELAKILAISFNDWGTAEARMNEDEKALHTFSAMLSDGTLLLRTHE